MLEDSTRLEEIIFFLEGSARHKVFIPKRSVWDGYIIPQRNTTSPIFECLWKLKKGDMTGRAFAESTVKAVGKKLRHLSRLWSMVQAEP